MRRWGIIVTAYYAVILVILLLPGAGFLWLGSDMDDLAEALADVLGGLFSVESVLDSAWIAWLAVVVFVTAQALLLFLSVDTSFKRLRPRRRVTLSVSVITFAVGMLTLAALWSISVAIWSDEAFEWLWLIIGAPLISWATWGVVFYLHREQLSERLDRAVTRLLGGSVLQLLIAVPCHVIVRNRGGCSAPGVTSYGIATGIAIMLMAFGPSVLFLYQKRLREYGIDATTRLARPRRIVSATLGILALAAVALALFSPVDDDWLSYPEISERQSPAASSAIIDVASSFGMMVQPQNEAVTLLLCNGDLIGRVQATVAQDDGTERWVIAIRADQAELTAALASVLESYATEPFFTLPPAMVNQWRARIAYGTVLRRDCDPR